MLQRALARASALWAPAGWLGSFTGHAGTSHHGQCAYTQPSRLTHSEVVLAMGSNQGNRVNSLLQGLKQLSQYGIEVLRVSLLYETAPVHVLDQPSYLNAAVLARTDLPPLQLLYNLKQIEKAAGRDLAGLRWGPRPLDLDIVFYGSNHVDHECLTIPHERWHERSFVKAPVVDLLLPSDEERGYICECDTGASALPKLVQAARMWQSEGGEQQVGHAGLCRVLPVQRQIWELGSTTHIMGILNVTPDSFSDGGKTSSVPAAVEAARAMVDAGACVIDVGGQSTRPGAGMLSPGQELERVIPVITALREDSQLVHVPVSIDTFHASVARAAVSAGADMVNDVSGGALDAHMLPAVASMGVPFVLMHIRGDPRTMQLPVNTTYGPDGVAAQVAVELRARAEAAIAAGILPWNLVLDPGLGFAKTRAGSVELLARLQEMQQALEGIYGRMPLLVGPSRKGFLGALTGQTIAAERDVATVAACVVAVGNGANIVRVHNVPMVAQGLAVADAVYRRVLPHSMDH